MSKVTEKVETTKSSYRETVQNFVSGEKSINFSPIDK
jgi:hypothetical protein